MKTAICLLMLIGIVSCKKAEVDSVKPEYTDWYTLRSPVDKEIQGVWGDWDRTLLITTGYAVFRSTDKGRHWQQVYQQSNGIFGIVQNQDTLFTMTGLTNQTLKDFYQQVLIHADNFSLDDGQTWQRYTKRNPLLDEPRSGQPIDKRLLINPVTASTGTTYRINRVFVDPTATTGHFETPGVITSDGRRVDLPQLHQLNSLYLDSKQRLYMAGSDAVCGRGGKTGEPFSFCNKGRGAVYISKSSTP
jgi:hypothetical protein